MKWAGRRESAPTAINTATATGYPATAMKTAPAAPLATPFAALFLLTAVLLVPAARGADIELLDRIAAVVNEDVILASDLSHATAQLAREARQRNQRLPPAGVLRKQVLERLIVEQLQLQEAQRRGISIDERSLDQTLERIAERNSLSLADFRLALIDQGYSWSRFRGNIRREMIISRLRSRAVLDRINVSEQEIEDYLAERARGSAEQLEYRLQHLLVGLPQNATPEAIEDARSRAEQLRGQLDAGVDFALLAASHSDGQRALEGGDLGWRPLNKLPALFAEALRGGDEGDLAGPLRSANGFHLLRIDGVRGGERHIVRQSRARHILLKPNAIRDAEATRSELQLLRDRIAAGGDFAELARAHSEDTGSAVDGGDLGWFGPGVMVPAFQDVVDSLRPGELSQPFRSPFGWHLVQLLGRRDRDETEEVLQSEARQAVRESKAAEETELWLRQLRSEAFVELRDGG